MLLKLYGETLLGVAFIAPFSSEASPQTDPAAAGRRIIIPLLARPGPVRAGEAK